MQRRIMGYILPAGADKAKACADEVKRVDSILSAASAKSALAEKAPKVLSAAKIERADGSEADGVLVDLVFADDDSHGKAWADLKKEAGARLRTHQCRHYDEKGNPCEADGPCVVDEEVDNATLADER